MKCFRQLGVVCLIFIYGVPEDVMGNYQIYLKFLYMISLYDKLHVYTNV